MNKKGFTLLELLGVITVLGLISILVAPTIINQIKKSQNQIDEITMELIYSATDLYLDNKLADYPKNNGSTYCLTLQKLVNDGKLSSPLLDSNGNEIDLDKLVAINVLNNSYTYEMVDSCEVVQTHKNNFMVSNNSCIKDTNTTCPVGTEVNVMVNNSQDYNFYVINDSGSKLTLIADRNIGDNAAWYKDGDDTTTNETNSLGPITALNYLNEQTSNWINIKPIISYIYNNNLNGTTNENGYQKLTITNGSGILMSQDGTTTTNLTGTMRARLLTYEEASALKNANSNSTPTWLYKNLSIYNTVEEPYGYWYLTSLSNMSGHGHGMIYNGNISTYLNVFIDATLGIRPVIEIYK